MAFSEPPASLYAGDSNSWTKGFTNYPATSHVARWVFSALNTDPVVIYGTANGNDFDFALTPELSAGMLGGEWSWACRVTKISGTESKIAATGSVTVRQDPAALNRTKSRNEKILELIDAALEERAVDVHSFGVLGQDITKTSATDLMALRNRFQALVNKERQVEEYRRTGVRRRPGRMFLG